MIYSVKFESSALREFNKLDRNTQDRLGPKIRALANDPRPPGVKKLRGFKNRYRIRVGDHRVIYDIHDNILRVLVVKVGPRGDVYNN